MKRYCLSTSQTKRFKTREVKVGNVKVGNDNPLRIQSMTTSNTQDVEATVLQIMKLADIGCEIVRVTVQGKKEALACEKIKNQLLQKGYTTPIVADIHFYPPAALLACEFVDKIRINPGNFADKRATFKVIEYDEISYQNELDRIEELFSPLVEKCKRWKKAIRIGANHGSLSDRIMNRYGDTPQGMVESCFEFLKICRKLDFHDVFFSMKSSNPIVMVHAYRLLVSEMLAQGFDYPIHLGVTEAGFQQEGRIKSAVGIGSLLIDGIGDTIRVSLTEDPWEEIEPCKKLKNVFEKMQKISNMAFLEDNRDFQNLQKRPIIYPKDFDSKGMVYQNKEELKNRDDLIVFEPKISIVHETRSFVENLKKEKNTKPLVVVCNFEEIMESSMMLGSILIDGLVEGIVVKDSSYGDNLLQACRMKMVKTDFISCPSCGRTLFDLQSVTKKIKEKTGHLPGVKIAVMGCIVNGPGEMADADFGYVGSRPGKIDLYEGKKLVCKDVDFNDADNKLIELIKLSGKWVDNMI